MSTEARSTRARCSSGVAKRCVLLLCASCWLIGGRAWSADDAPPEPAQLHRIAFGSCFDANKPADIWDAVLAAEPDLMVLLGDNVYADTEDMDRMRAEYAKLGAIQAFANLRETCPILATWDDHDYGKNDAGAEYPMRREAQQVMLECFEEPPDSPRWAREGVYGAQVFGPPGRRVQVILFDTRYFRSPLRERPKTEITPLNPGPYIPNMDETATMLGEAQWSWLAEQLRVPAELRLIASSIQVVAEEHGFEKWANFPHERERLFRTIREAKAEGVMILSGDRHMAELSRLDGAVGYPLYDVTSSALNRPRAWMLEPNRHRLGSRFIGETFYEANFGVIDIEWLGDNDAKLSVQIRNKDGRVVLRHEIRLNELRNTNAGNRPPP